MCLRPHSICARLARTLIDSELSQGQSIAGWTHTHTHTAALISMAYSHSINAFVWLESSSLSLNMMYQQRVQNSHYSDAAFNLIIITVYNLRAFMLHLRSLVMLLKEQDTNSKVLRTLSGRGLVDITRELNGQGQVDITSPAD